MGFLATNEEIKEHLFNDVEIKWVLEDKCWFKQKQLRRITSNLGSMKSFYIEVFQNPSSNLRENMKTRVLKSKEL